VFKLVGGGRTLQTVDMCCENVGKRARDKLVSVC